MSEHGPCIMVGDRELVGRFPELVRADDPVTGDPAWPRLLHKGFFAPFGGMSYVRTDRGRRALGAPVWRGGRAGADPAGGDR